MTLPPLSPTPKHHPDCCVSLSTTLLSTLAALLPGASASVLSIGSGTGLFEAYLSSHAPHLTVEGVEVDSTVNRYLPEERAYTVGGTWDLCPRAEAVSTWIFVYPRDPGLVKRYLEAFAHGSVRCVVWLGPMVDWADYEAGLEAPGFTAVEVVEECALAPYEMMAVIKKQSSDA